MKLGRCRSLAWSQSLCEARRMRGYVRAVPEIFADHILRERLLDAAVVFTLSLPKK